MLALKLGEAGVGVLRRLGQGLAEALAQFPQAVGEGGREAGQVRLAGRRLGSRRRRRFRARQGLGEAGDEAVDQGVRVGGRVFIIGELDPRFEGGGEQAGVVLFARVQVGLQLLGVGVVGAGRELQGLGAQGGRAVGGGQAHQVGLARAGEVRLDLDRGEFLLIGGDVALQGLIALDLRVEGDALLGLAADLDVVFLDLHGGDVAQGGEGAGGRGVAVVLNVDARRVGLGIVGGRDVAQPLRLDGAAVRGRQAGDGDAGELGGALLRHGASGDLQGGWPCQRVRLQITADRRLFSRRCCGAGRT